MIVNFKSAKTIIAGLYRDLDVNIELGEQSIIEWIAEGLSLIGSYSQMEEKSAVITVVNHRVQLPCDFVYPKDITFNGKPLSWSTKSAANNYQCPECNTVPTCCTDYNFYISDGFINTSLESGDLCIVYLGIPVDDEGYPLVPDDVYFDKALKAYCTFMLDRIQFRRGLIPDKVYQESKTEWLWYVGAAKGSANMPSTAQMDRLMKVWVRLIPKPHEFNNNFNSLENHERRNLR